MLALGGASTAHPVPGAGAQLPPHLHGAHHPPRAVRGRGLQQGCARDRTYCKALWLMLKSGLNEVLFVLKL